MDPEGQDFEPFHARMDNLGALEALSRRTPFFRGKATMKRLLTPAFVSLLLLAACDGQSNAPAPASATDQKTAAAPSSGNGSARFFAKP